MKALAEFAGAVLLELVQQTWRRLTTRKPRPDAQAQRQGTAAGEAARRESKLVRRLDARIQQTTPGPRVTGVEKVNDR